MRNRHIYIFTTYLFIQILTIPFFDEKKKKKNIPVDGASTPLQAQNLRRGSAVDSKHSKSVVKTQHEIHERSRSEAAARAT